MRTLRKAIAGATICAAVLAGATWKSIEAQTTKKDAPTATAKKDASRRVPRHFGKVGLTDDQKEQIYKIQAKHHEKIAELQKQLDHMRAELTTECEAVLTPEQHKLLEKLRKPSAPGTESEKTAEKK